MLFIPVSSNSAVVGMCINDYIARNIFILNFTKESPRKVRKRQNI